jgi:hypothetical protein
MNAPFVYHDVSLSPKIFICQRMKDMGYVKKKVHAKKHEKKWTSIQIIKQ